MTWSFRRGLSNTAIAAALVTSLLGASASAQVNPGLRDTITALSPSIQGAIESVSKAAGAQITDIQAFPIGDVPNMRATWIVAPVSSGETGTRHGGINITLFISPPASDTEVSAFVGQKAQEWLKGNKSNEEKAQDWAQFLLSRNSGFPLDRVPEPFRAAAVAGGARADEAFAKQDAGSVDRRQNALQSILTPEQQAFFQHLVLMPPVEFWSTPFSVANGSGVSLESAGLESIKPYVNNSYWPCGDRLVMLEISVQGPGLDHHYIEDASAILAAWHRYGESVREAVISALPCAPKCSDATGAGLTAHGNVQTGPWKANYEVVDQQGLVLRNLTAEDKPILADVRVPHFEMTWEPNGSRIIRFDAKLDIARFEWKAGEDTLSWCFQKTFDEPELKGVLTVFYDFIIRGRGETDPNCTHFLITPRECFRFIPLLRMDWAGERPRKLLTFAPFYRFDYGRVGLALTKDPEHFYTAPFAAGREWFLTHETSFPGGFYNPNDPLETLPGTYDNMHTALPITEHNFVGVPVCRNWTFDCVHTHWRWGSTSAPGIAVDPMTDPVSGMHMPPELRGKFYLAPAQQIGIGIVLAKAGEPGDPDDPFKLVDGDEIATISRFDPTSDTYFRQRLSSVAGNILVWFKLTAHLSGPEPAFNDSVLASPSFFRNGFFILRRGDSFAPRFFHIITMHDPSHHPDQETPTEEQFALFEDDSYQTLRPDRGAQAFAMLRDAVAARRGAPGEANEIASEGFFLLADITRWTMIKALDAQQGALIGNNPQPVEPTPWLGPELPPGPARSLLEKASERLQTAQTMMMENPGRFAEALPVLQEAWEAAIAAAPQQAPL